MKSVYSKARGEQSSRLHSSLSHRRRERDTGAGIGCGWALGPEEEPSRQKSWSKPASGWMKRKRELPTAGVSIGLQARKGSLTGHRRAVAIDDINVPQKPARSSFGVSPDFLNCGIKVGVCGDGKIR
jgi:hypothetical protein